MNKMYLPEGPTRPAAAALEAFWSRARAALPAQQSGADYQVRWIGLDAPSTRQIFELIRSGDKTGTFTLPWIVERTGSPRPAVGDLLILIDFDGTPTLLVRTERVHEVAFGKVTAQDTAIDGSPVRDLAVWKPLHTAYWGALLQPFGLAVSADMPVWVEKFVLLYDGAAAAAP
jgi:uncharacterized protein YhfF